MKSLTKSLTKLFIKLKNLLQFEDFVRSTNASAKSESIFQNFLNKRSEFHRRFSNKNVFQKVLKTEVESASRFKFLIKQIFSHNILLRNDDSIISDDERDVAERDVAERDVAERNVAERDVEERDVKERNVEERDVEDKFIISSNHQSKESLEAKRQSREQDQTDNESFSKRRQITERQFSRSDRQFNKSDRIKELRSIRDTYVKESDYFNREKRDRAREKRKRVIDRVKQIVAMKFEDEVLKELNILARRYFLIFLFNSMLDESLRTILSEMKITHAVYKMYRHKLMSFYKQ